MKTAEQRNGSPPATEHPGSRPMMLRDYSPLNPGPQLPIRELGAAIEAIINLYNAAAGDAEPLEDDDPAEPNDEGDLAWVERTNQTKEPLPFTGTWNEDVEDDEAGGDTSGDEGEPLFEKVHSRDVEGAFRRRSRRRIHARQRPRGWRSLMLRLPPQPPILLAEDAEGDGFCVEVIPPHAGPGHDRCFISYLDARAYARLLRFGNGWTIVDCVDPKTRKVAEEAEQRPLEARHG